METLKNALKEKGLKPTYQRLKILEYLERHLDVHPTVEMIYEAFAGKIPTISITTIYNTLNAFMEKGLVCAVTITGTEVRYDCMATPHHHFLCKRCGKILDIDIQCPVVEKREAIGHQIDEVHGYFKGICKECLGKETQPSKPKDSK